MPLRHIAACGGQPQPAPRRLAQRPHGLAALVELHERRPRGRGWYAQRLHRLSAEDGLQVAVQLMNGELDLRHDVWWRAMRQWQLQLPRLDTPCHALLLLWGGCGLGR